MIVIIKPGDVPREKWRAARLRAFKPYVIGSGLAIGYAAIAVSFGARSAIVVLPAFGLLLIGGFWSTAQVFSGQPECPYCRWPLLVWPKSNGRYEGRWMDAYLFDKRCPKCSADFTVPFEK